MRGVCLIERTGSLCSSVRNGGDRLKANQWIWLLIVPACLSAAFVVVAHPSEYGFYTLSRLLVTVAAATTAFLVWEKQPGFGIVLAGLAVLFNPLVKVHLGRELWVVADIIAIILLIAGGMRLSASRSHDENQEV